MHSLFEQASCLSGSLIGAAIEVHRDKGPGLIESIYEWRLSKELELRSLSCVNQRIVVVRYKGFTREEPLRCDLLIEGCVLLEVKAVKEIPPIRKAQLLSYMKLLLLPPVQERKRRAAICGNLEAKTLRSGPSDTKQKGK